MERDNKFMAEDKFEHAIIEKLKDEGWDYLYEYSGVTDDKLYDHWRDILNQNNAKRLDGVSLTDSEFEQIKLELFNNRTPYDAQLMLAGAGGVGTIPLIRDDGTQIEVEIFYGDEVAGGHSRYEIVNQITFNNLAYSLSTKRRIDIMLLIDGIPVANVEEKDESLQNQWNAFEQLQKYDGDGMYMGLFSFVQVQFVLSQHSAHYLARPKNSSSYNRDFVFGWRDENGKDITNTMEFIHSVMGIPALHRLVTVNMIPDASNDNLMVMRSYQIQATRMILDRMREMNNNDLVEKEGGYIWHTTGSGKTVTSFKVAQLLASMPRVQDVLFIVDRVDLVNQTYENFKSFAYKTFENRIKIVNGNELKRELKHNQTSHIYLITIQALDKAVKSGGSDVLSNNRMVILMDEAHRSASGDSVTRIKQALPRTSWFGFTGTPNFYSDDSNEVKTSKSISTYDIFGKRLHRYTIKDAIGDGNVLGFDVTYYESVYETDAASNMSEQDLEKAVYTSLPFRTAVVQDIKENWQANASGPIEMGVRKPNQFQGMLAVSGKQAVSAYYGLFKQLAPELRVAMTYSRDEDNGMGTSDLQTSLKKGMQDYIERYGTRNFLDDKDPEHAYLNDMTKRISRKKPYNQGNDDDRLDLIIVSDQLLTGFDSKFVNIIYMDKIMQEGPLIQAMSRTNRTIDKNAKPHGKVRFYRKGTVMEENVKNALVIYTKGGNDTLADVDKLPNQDDQNVLVKVGILSSSIVDQINELQPQIERLQELSGDDFSQLPRSEKEKVEFAVTAAEVNSKVQRLVQQGYNFGDELEGSEDTVKLGIQSSEELSSLQARMNDVNELLPSEKRIDLTNIKIAIQSFATEIIDYDLLVDLLNEYMDETTLDKRNAVEEHIKPLDQNSREEIDAVLYGIEQGDYKEHFDTESLKSVRKSIRNEKQELKIYKWAADNNYNGNDILMAYSLYLPGLELVDNPKLNNKLQEIESKLDIGFFETANFEESLMNYFNDINYKN